MSRDYRCPIDHGDTTELEYDHVKIDDKCVQSNGKGVNELTAKIT